MKHLKYAITIVALLTCCAINAQWVNEYTGENLNDIFNSADYQTTALAYNTMLEQDPAWFNNDINTLNDTKVANGAVLPGGGGSGTGVAIIPTGDAMWIILLFFAAIIAIREYQHHKTTTKRKV